MRGNNVLNLSFGGKRGKSELDRGFNAGRNNGRVRAYSGKQAERLKRDGTVKKIERMRPASEKSSRHMECS